MITLITGTSGSGKTAKIVHYLSTVKDRPIYTMGIRGLKIPHQPTPPVAEWTTQEPTPEDPSISRAVFTFPEKSIIVIDEAQDLFRPRMNGSKVPDIVAAFETHRHLAIDFILITQSPTYLDAQIRRNLDKHWHIHKHPFGKTLLEWAACGDPESKADRDRAVSVPYKPPKAAFSLYESTKTGTHTQTKRTLPKSVYMAATAIIALLVLVPYIYSRISDRVHPKDSLLAQKPKPINPVADMPSSGIPAGSQILTSLEQTIPAIPDRPETAPMYDNLRVVKSMPQIQGCIEAGDTCKCFTQQGTKADLSSKACHDWVHNRPFNPYLENVSIAAAGGGGTPPTTQHRDIEIPEKLDGSQPQASGITQQPQ
jgi:zona occludens toxin